MFLALKSSFDSIWTLVHSLATLSLRTDVVRTP
eukprot:COSAG06_NODE_58781_length_276_cov_0.581921_1_plen_32_part_01